MSEWVHQSDLEDYWDDSTLESQLTASGCPDVEAALELCALMSEISEEQYCAGWEIGLEYSLFAAAFEGVPYGDGPSMHQRQGLLELSRRCNGWWTYEARFGQRYVQMQVWTEMYKRG